MKKFFVFAVATAFAGVFVSDSFALGCGNSSGLRGKKIRSKSNCASSCSSKPVVAPAAPAPAKVETKKVEIKVESSCANGKCNLNSIRGKIRIR